MQYIPKCVSGSNVDTGVPFRPLLWSYSELNGQ